MDFFNITLPDRKRDIEIHSRYGTRFNFWEKIRMGGNGSPRLYYVNGLAQLDEKIYLNQVPIANLELWRDSVMIHFHLATNAQNFILAIHHHEIRSIIEMKTSSVYTGNLNPDIENMCLFEMLINEIHLILACKKQVRNSFITFLQKHFHSKLKS